MHYTITPHLNQHRIKYITSGGLKLALLSESMVLACALVLSQIVVVCRLLKLLSLMLTPSTNSLECAIAWNCKALFRIHIWKRCR